MQYEIKMLDDNLLLKKVETKETGEFTVTDDADQGGPVFEICHSNTHEAGVKVLLKPGHYDEVLVNFERFTFAKANDIFASVEEVK